MARSVTLPAVTCRRGHAIDAENSYVCASGFRVCRVCRRMRERKISPVVMSRRLLAVIFRGTR